VLLTGKAVEATRRRSGGHRLYDAVVMDAPPTGRIGRFLNVATEVSGLAKVGPIRGHADTVQGVIRSPQTAVHFVTVLEEMPVQETLDGLAELRGLAGGGLQLGAVMINMVRPTGLTDGQLLAAARGELDTHELGLGLKAAGIDGSIGPAAGPDVATALAAELGEHSLEVLSQREHRQLLADTGQPCYELPLITDGMGLAGLYRLAAALREQGAA
jgi:hypothetical protein